ncbi:transposase [Desulfobacterales bacterium HSG17]|nr:transposase [Desulfobacterales bacterium HSG17]
MVTMYQWLWVFILLPFLEEDSLNELSEKPGLKLRKLYKILIRHSDAFEKLLRMLTLPIFFELMDKFNKSDETGKSRRRIRIIFDDTNVEKYGKCMEFIHKLFDHAKDRYIMGYNYVLLLAVSDDMVFPLSFVLWLPKEHPDYRSKNDIARDEILHLEKECDKNGYCLEEVEILFDSAYCVPKVMKTANDAGLRIVTKSGNTHKFEFEGEQLTPSEIIEKVKDRQWKYLEAAHCYQRLSVQHHVYGQVVLTVRRRELKNGKIIYDVLICNKSYKKRWEIEMHFKYYKQYLSLGKTQFQKEGAIRSHLLCVAITALIVALFRCQSVRKISFRRAVRLISHKLYCP